jgi:hypothetical protein
MLKSVIRLLLLATLASTAAAQFPLQSPQRPNLPLLATDKSHSLLAAPSGSFLYSYNSAGRIIHISGSIEGDLQGKIRAFCQSPPTAVLEDGRVVVWPSNDYQLGGGSLMSPGTKIFTQLNAVGLFKSGMYGGSIFVSTQSGSIVRLVVNNPTPGQNNATIDASPWPANSPAVHELTQAYWIYQSDRYVQRFLVHGRDGSLTLRDAEGAIVAEPGVPGNCATGIVQFVPAGNCFAALKSDGTLGAFVYRQGDSSQEAQLIALSLTGIDDSVRFNRLEMGPSCIVAYSDSGIYGISLMFTSGDQTSIAVRALDLDTTTTAKVLLTDLHEAGDRGRVLRRSGEVYEWGTGQYAQDKLLFENVVDIGRTASAGMYGGSKFYLETADGVLYVDLGDSDLRPLSDYVSTDSMYGEFLSSDMAPALGFSLPILARAVANEILSHETNYGLATKPDLLSAVQQAAAQGVASVQSSPNDFNLYSDAQYQANYSSGVAAGTSLVTANPANYNLYTSNSIMDLAVGGLMVQKQGSSATVVFQTQTTTNLSQSFTNNGTPITNTVPMPGNTGFLRVRAAPMATPSPR